VRNTNILVLTSSRGKKLGTDGTMINAAYKNRIELVLCELQWLSPVKSVIQIRVPEWADNPLNDYQLLIENLLHVCS
jgi:hypothetical protein